MIIKARANNNAGNLARYLLRTKKNETERLWELRDSASENLSKALTDWEVIGRSKTKAEGILYHSHIRLADGENLKEAQWYKVIEDLEVKLGFTNCPRAIVGHNNSEKGLHLHIIWSRWDRVTGKLASLSNDRQQHHAVARAAEKEFGLTQVKDKTLEVGRNRKKRLSDMEIRALKDRGIDKAKLEKMVAAAWRGTDTGEEMRAMLGALGVEIKPGDRRDWVIAYKGLEMNPVRLLPDVNEAIFRERMKDIDLSKEKAKYHGGPEALWGKRAEHLNKEFAKTSFANDEPKQAKAGFTKRRRKTGPQPKFKKKMWYGDPGI